ncbi:MAG: AmmeMemoRadiSam system protein B, partial [Candidatus Aminicenantes bacterium]|nr:AmmeMemoRadiSam system protein B [Candidatus Aminicenantes bacterium]
KKILLIVLSVILLASLNWSQGLRKAVCAGQYYDKNPEILSHQIDYFLQNVKFDSYPGGKILALIAPHAGHICSGQAAAFAYKLVQGKDYETVVIIAPSHSYGFDGCSIYLKGGYETPLGVAKINESLALELSKASGFKYIPKAHQMEHAVEVQVPFIQKTMPQAKIVPIIMGNPAKETITRLASALKKVLPEKKALVIASTDMSHFFSKKKAHDIDMKTVSLIKSFETNSLIRKLERGENIMCGGGPVVSTLLYVQKSGKPTVKPLQYADSTRCGSPESRVVGYFAAAIYSEAPAPKLTLSSEEKKELLRLAHAAINLFIRENKIFNYKTQNPNLLTEKGAFVTLKKGGRLRGCIGFIEPALPLYQTVIQAAIYAACRDARFIPVSPHEIKDLKIEISVLSPLKKIKNPRLVEVGRHGLVIAKADKKGLLLPQVAVENHWSRETFLQQACLKAGLPHDAWKSDADVFIFEAIVFH